MNKPIDITLEYFHELSKRGCSLRQIKRIFGFDVVKITYLDNSTKQLSWLDWLNLRSGILENLHEKGKCTIEFYNRGKLI